MAVADDIAPKARDVASSPPIIKPQTPPALTAAQMAIVKATAPVLEEHGVTITTVFYRNLLAAHPQLRNMFSSTAQDSGRQARALAGAVLAYARHVDDLGRLAGAVERIAQKHVSLGVQPDQYAVVGRYLLGAIGEVLGAAATAEVVDAWTAAYNALASVFVSREAALYAATVNSGGPTAWATAAAATSSDGDSNVWRRFRVAARAAEAHGIDSFYLAPLDGSPLPAFLPGQYVSLRAFVPRLGHWQTRQYSLSQAPPALVGGEEGNRYRITVRRDDGQQPTHAAGLVSNLLHDRFRVGDEVELSHPQGDFFVDPADTSKDGAPLVLISAGVGATPVMSILEAATRTTPEREGSLAKRPISWLHASRSRAVQPFADAVRCIRQANPDRVSSVVFLRQVDDAVDREGFHYDFAGTRMDLARADSNSHLFVTEPAAEYYVCGPEGFMVDMRQALEHMGVAQGRIHLELFGTGSI